MAGKTQRFKAVRMPHVGEIIKVVAKQTYADGRPFFEFTTEVVGKLIIASRNWCLIDLSKLGQEQDLYYDGDLAQWFLFGLFGNFPVNVTSLKPLSQSSQNGTQPVEHGFVPQKGQIIQLDGQSKNVYQPWVVEDFILLGKVLTVQDVPPYIHIPLLFPSFCIWKEYAYAGLTVVGIRASDDSVKWELRTAAGPLPVELTMVKDPLLA